MVDLRDVMTSTIKPVRHGFEDAMKKLIDLEDCVAEVGWFESSGKHPTADMTYPELAKYHATGQEGVAVRDVLSVACVWFNPNYYPSIGDALQTYLDHPVKTNIKGITEEIGKSLWTEAHNTIGNANRLAVTYNPTPLVDSGALDSQLKYRTNERIRPRRG